MPDFILSKRSLGRLEGVHDDLVRVVKRAIEVTQQDFSVLEGLRDIERQRELMLRGASKTMNSRHLTGHAVDLGAYVGGGIRWEWELYVAISRAMFMAAEDCAVHIEWGGHWKTFPDGPHFQLPWGGYPK
jgi:peptidoglycan L-alanyl-D-glutamate endopeptidase CwlK